MTPTVLSDKCRLGRWRAWGQTMCCGLIGAAWLVAHLTKNNIRFCMRCQKSSGGWAAVRSFARSDQMDAVVTLNKPNAQDCADYLCSGVGTETAIKRKRDRTCGTLWACSLNS